MAPMPAATSATCVVRRGTSITRVMGRLDRGDGVPCQARVRAVVRAVTCLDGCLFARRASGATQFPATGLVRAHLTTRVGTSSCQPRASARVLLFEGPDSAVA